MKEDGYFVNQDKPMPTYEEAVQQQQLQERSNTIDPVTAAEPVQLLSAQLPSIDTTVYTHTAGIYSV